jgi:leader peptidase (prepilin peptidase)/N-methyltransferase
MIVAFVFILGLFIGSFLNVVIYRLHREESFVKGFSKCLFCGHRLYPKDLVPIFSFLWLKAKCRYCKTAISWQYFLVELATALGFVLVFLRLFVSTDLQTWLGALNFLSVFQLLFWWLMFCFLLIIFVYDLKYYLILDKVSIPAIILALGFNLFIGQTWQSLALGILLGGGFFLLQFILSQGKWIGGGDIRVGFLMGALLGFSHVLAALFLAYILGGLFATVLLLSGKKHLGDKLPFGTFLTLSTFMILLYGDVLIRWYLTVWSI